MNFRPTLETIHLDGFDPDRMVELMPQVRLDHLLLRSADCHLRHRRWECDGIAIDTGQYSFPVCITGEFSPTRVCIGYMRQLSVPTWVNGFEADRTSLEFYPAGSELNYRAGSDGQWLGITVEETRLQEAACEWIGREAKLPRDAMASFRIGSELRDELDRSIQWLMAQTEVTDLMLTVFLGQIAELVDQVSRGASNTALQSARRTKGQIARANAYMRRHLARGFDLRSTAAAVGTSERTLQRVYNQAYRMSPAQWTRCLALHEVRNQLHLGKGRNHTIEGIARDCGFNHMGRFSSYYKELFGEMPVETLTSKRRKV